MKLLKDLNSVKDYKLIIKFLNHKLIPKNMETDLLYEYKYIKKNNETNRTEVYVVTNRVLIKDILGIEIHATIEYDVNAYGMGANITDKLHLNVYYAVFNIKDDFEKNSTALAKKIDADLSTLAKKDPILANEIRSRYLENMDAETYFANMNYPEDVIYEDASKIYKSIYEFLGNYRNNDLLLMIEIMIKANNMADIEIYDDFNGNL